MVMLARSSGSKPVGVGASVVSSSVVISLTEVSLVVAFLIDVSSDEE